MNLRRIFTLALACAALLAAQGAPANNSLLTTFQNPVGNLISVPFQNNINFPIGQYSRNQNVLNIQPVVPINVNPDWLVVTRWIVPLVYQPNLASTCDSSGATGDVVCDSPGTSSPHGGAFGLGDLNPTFFLSPARPGKLIWGFGPTFLLPTATDHEVGQGKWGAGPSIVLLTQPRHWTLGILANNIWSFAGTQGRPRVNQFLTQYFVTRNFERGWFLTSSPIITANWRASDNNQWLVPFGGGFGKMMQLFDQTIVWQTHLYYNAIHPQDLPYPKWQVRLQIALLFPK